MDGAFDLMMRLIPSQKFQDERSAASLYSEFLCAGVLLLFRRITRPPRECPAATFATAMMHVLNALPFLRKMPVRTFSTIPMTEMETKLHSNVKYRSFDEWNEINY